MLAENTDSAWVQGGAAGALFGVVLYFIKRGDAREEAALAVAAAREQMLQAQISERDTRIEHLEAQLLLRAERPERKGK